MIKMHKSIQITDEDELAAESSQSSSTSHTTQSAPASSTPKSISILGGSFSTINADDLHYYYYTGEAKMYVAFKYTACTYKKIS